MIACMLLLILLSVVSFFAWSAAWNASLNCYHSSPWVSTFFLSSSMSPLEQSAMHCVGLEMFTYLSMMDVILGASFHLCFFSKLWLIMAPMLALLAAACFGSWRAIVDPRFLFSLQQTLCAVQISTLCSAVSFWWLPSKYRQEINEMLCGKLESIKRSKVLRQAPGCIVCWSEAGWALGLCK